MRRSINNLVKIISQTISVPEPIYEFGSYQVKGQEKISNLRVYFPDKEYIGCDMRLGPGVDRILNLHDIDLPDNSVGTILALDTFEHVEFPHKAIQEIYRVLKPNGIVVISSVMNFPIHEHPHDYWRFTPDGFRSLLDKFSQKWIGWSGDPLFPHTVIGIGIKEVHIEFDNFLNQYHSWLKRPYLKGFLSQFIPPIIPRVFRKIKNQFNP